MPRITSTALMSHEATSQALISLGCYYYEHFHDNPNSEVEALVDVIDKCLLGMETHDPQASIERASGRSEKIETLAPPATQINSEFEPEAGDGAFPPADQKQPNQCPYCDASIPTDAEVCATCGSSLS